MLPFLPLLGSLISKGMDLGGKFVLDKDKQAEYAFKQQEMTFKLIEQAINQPTPQWINAIVKLMWAFQPVWRPLGSLALAAVGIYAKVHGIDLGQYVSEGMISLPLLWGLSREADKRRNKRTDV